MILCAALRLKLPDADDYVVVPCCRHGCGYGILRDLGFSQQEVAEMRSVGGIVEGFIDTKDYFYDRTEALEHAISCGQLSASVRQQKVVRGSTELYSEDLY